MATADGTGCTQCNHIDAATQPEAMQFPLSLNNNTMCATKWAGVFHQTLHHTLMGTLTC